ncbi:MAG: hypothetical protein OHK0021_08980 [Bryobacter sp.]
MKVITLALAILPLSLATPLSAQETPPAASAYEADTRTLDSTVRALYAVISGPPGARDWKRFLHLFHPAARMAAIRAQGGAVSFSPTEYIERNRKAMEVRGFYEEETERKVETEGSLSVVWSGFAIRAKADGAEGAGQALARGHNSLQVYYDGTRWWILHLVWANAPSPDSSARE